MRLIDADKLEPNCIYTSTLEKADTVYQYSYSEQQIEKAPTVEAIPIKWIYLWRLKNMDKCPVDYIPFSALLNDWEKENARD